MPNASCSWSENQKACAAGQKKKTSVTAICGASSAYGSQVERKTTRFSTQFLAFVGCFELPQDFVAPFHRVVQGCLRVLLAGEDRFQLLLDDLAALHVVAEAQA